jgi:hypothetical protein
MRSSTYRDPIFFEVIILNFFKITKISEQEYISSRAAV